MNQVLDEIDDRITRSTERVETQLATLRTAQALRTQLETERRQASGRLGAGDATGGPDLDRLGAELIEARHAVQDAENAVMAATAALPLLQTERRQATTAEVLRHLTALFPVRAALAAAIHACLMNLTATIQLYGVAVRESVGLTAALPEPASLVPPSMDGCVARACIQALRSAVPSEFPYGNATIEPPLPTSDATVTQHVRAALARLAPAPSAGDPEPPR